MSKIDAEGHYTLLTRSARDKGLLEIEVPCPELGKARVVADFGEGVVSTRIEGIEMGDEALKELRQFSLDRNSEAVSPATGVEGIASRTILHEIGEAVAVGVRITTVP